MPQAAIAQPLLHNAPLPPLQRRDEELGAYRIAARAKGATHMIVIETNGHITDVQPVFGGNTALGNRCPVAQMALTQVTAETPGSYCWIEWL